MNKKNKREIETFGWFSDEEVQECIDEMHPEVVDNICKFVDALEEEPTNPYDNLWTTCPGVTGQTARWMLEAAQFPQPELSVSAALVFVANVKAHRVRTETNLRTNLSILNVAPSGTGKNWPMEAIRLLAEECSMQGTLLPEPASDSAVITSLKNVSGRGLLVWDEFGDGLRKLCKGGNSSVYLREILVVMKKLFSCAGSSHQGLGYAQRETVHLKQPCLSVLGSSTPDNLYSSLSSALAEDGFLSRFLFVEPENPEVDERSVSRKSPPNELVMRIRQIAEWPTNYGCNESRGSLAFLDIKPRIVPLSSQAERLRPDYARYFRDKRNACGEKEVLRSVWNRGMEHTLKVALTVADGEEITVTDLFWAFEFVSTCLNSLVAKFRDRVADSENERALLKVKRIITESSSPITHSELVRKTQWVKSRKEREELLATLLDMGDVYIETLRTGGRPTKYYRLKRD